ncbi:probable aminoacyl tRNA synthase complex-interacting multifunctional protein 2 isoform X1 [Daphnia carinata]|uniref:probable aminoacyl tRNA synthase complex-interacting multifunctional protein 2 isoform X1 n=1 Tax=Daphnia carinata TaxID=120202 RepID=UPI00257EEC23|nr:probable aminoacyl tRNA synthase complex-interacting multifunctional protein 2 isoform X1 [Daphnia carinata]
MYKLQPLFKSVGETPHPSCVYKMKKISDHFNNKVTDGTDCNTEDNATSNNCEVEQLEKRWTEITSRLQRLQSELAAIKTGSSSGLSSFIDAGPAPPLTVKALAVQQDLLVLRISSLMTSLFELKSRLAVMDDPQSVSSTTVLQLQQRSLLERIRELNEEIRSISSALNSSNIQGQVPSTSQCLAGQIDVVGPGERSFQDLVIHASPSNPPHSLPLLRERMEKLGVSVYARTHVHSAVAGNKLLNDTLKSFISSDSRLERSQARMAITLIWIKAGDGEEPSLIVSPSSQAAAINGEANIVRYLARYVPGLLDYEDQPLKATQIDQFLDLTESTAPLGCRGSKRDRAATLQSLDNTLSSRKSLEESSNEVGLVDFVVYSALVNSCTEKDIGKNIRAWMDRCRSTVKQATAPSNSKRSILENYLTELGIAFRTLEHPAVFTVAAMMEHISHLAGFHAKNLLVKDKKTGKLYLITARHDAAIQLSQVSKMIGAKELRFADVETLEATLGVQQGSVTPFALLNDAQQQLVTFVLDGQLWDETNGKDSYLNFHPLTNEATTSITVAGFKTFLKATGHDPIIIQV